MKRKIMTALLAALLLIQFIRPSRNKADESPATDIAATVKVPGNVQSVLQNACYDCHSNNTQYPWYSNFQPFGWWLSGHIKYGKAELNFNNFGSYSRRRQMSKLNEIANSVKDGIMPLKTYAIMHPKARLSAQQKALLVNWASRARDSLRN